ERQKREEAQRAADRRAAEERRRKRTEEDRVRVEHEAIAAYWNSLTPEQQTGLETAARSQADPETLALAEGPLKRIGKQILRDPYIRKMLQGRGQSPSVGQ